MYKMGWNILKINYLYLFCFKSKVLVANQILGLLYVLNSSSVYVYL